MAANIFLNSPFVQLPHAMLSPAQTASATSQGQSAIHSAINPNMMAKQQRGRGTSPNLFAALSGFGGGQAASRMLPRQQEAADWKVNTDWQQSIDSANNQFADKAMRALFANANADQDLQMQRRSFAGNLLGALFPDF